MRDRCFWKGLNCMKHKFFPICCFYGQDHLEAGPTEHVPMALEQYATRNRSATLVLPPIPPSRRGGL